MKAEHLSLAVSMGETIDGLDLRKGQFAKIFIGGGVFTQAQLDEALQIQHDEGGLLGEVLIRKNMILPHEIMRAL